MFNLKTWLIKWLKGLGLVIFSTGLIYTADYINLSDLPTEYAFWGGLVVIICSQLGNWIKHTYLTD